MNQGREKMQTAKAITRYVRMTPQKARLVATLVRGMPVAAAFQQLIATKTRPARVITKTLKSAVANAENNYNMERSDLYIHKIQIDEGPRMKRFKAKNKGGTAPYVKKLSHITIEVGQR